MVIFRHGFTFPAVGVSDLVSLKLKSGESVNKALIFFFAAVHPTCEATGTTKTSAKLQLGVMRKRVL
ncbi:hypothetical protein FRC00_006524, partial [Tulasnella sp. 408]